MDNMNELRLRRFIRDIISEVTAGKQLSAADIIKAAREVLPKGYGDGAYISDVAKHLGMSVAALTPTLFDLFRRQEIDMRRADLVGAMDIDKVNASKIVHPMLRSAEYHFIVVRR